MNNWGQELEPVYFSEGFTSELENKSPGLWHQVVEALNTDATSTLQTLEWISAQPRCDKATIL